MVAEVNRIEAIETFLELWKERALKYYIEILNEMDRLNTLYSKTIDNFNRRWHLNEEDRKIVEQEHEKSWKALKAYQTLYKGIKNDIYDWGAQYKTERLEKILNREVESKRKILISRINKKVGQIIDANRLYIGVNGEINGIIVGELGTANVQTIYAGGYNIQCLHYRTLIK